MTELPELTDIKVKRDNFGNLRALLEISWKFKVSSGSGQSGNRIFYSASLVLDSFDWFL